MRKCKIWRCHTDTFTHRRFYAQTLLRRNTFTHRHLYTLWQRPLYIDFITHTHAFTHTCSELSLRILLWSAPDVQKQSSYTWQEQEGVWCELKGKFFRRHLEEWNNINRSQEELRNISRKLEWTRDSPQSQIAPTVQKDTWEVTFIRSCAEFKNPVVILVEKRHGGFWVGHAPSRFKNCRYVCTATWMGLRWPMPSKCPWAPCET